MAQTNIFRPLKEGKSNFFLFSQFGEDLTKEYTQKDSYRVVPSKFVCLNLNIPQFLNKGGSNARLVEILQNYYENFMTCARYDAATNAGSTAALTMSQIPEAANIKFWNTLAKWGLIGKDGDLEASASGDEVDTFNEVVYVGDINIYSSSTNDDGVSYNEIYCVIPNEAQKTVYPFIGTRLNEGTEDNNYISLKGLAEIESNSYYIWGWSAANAYSSELSYKAEFDTMPTNVSSDVQGCYNTNGFIMDGSPIIDDTATKFTFNAVLVLYDIINPSSSNAVVYSDIPMGIYFTGSIEDKALTNAVTKYCSSTEDSIYSEGTSYTLRIATRYLTTQNATEFQATKTDTSSLYPEYSAVMQSMANTVAQFENVVKTNDDIYSALTSYAANFKNNLTNVPYIKANNKGSLNWFVNGKDTGVAAQYETDTSQIIVPYGEGSINMYIRTNDMTARIAAGSATAKDLYIIDYDGESNTTSIKNVKVNKMYIGEQTLEEYIQEKQVLDASGLTYDINNKYLSDNLKNMLVGIADEGESATLERAIAQLGKGLDQKIDETCMLQTSEMHKNGQGWTTPDASALKNLVQGIKIDRNNSGEFDINIRQLGSDYDFMNTAVNTTSSVIDYKQLCLLLFAYIKSTITTES